MVVVDSLDLFIISKILQKKEVGTWNLAKIYFKKEVFENKREEKRYYDSKQHIIKKRLEELAKAGIILINGEPGEKTYQLITDKVKFTKKHKFFTSYHPAVHIKDNGLWTIYQI